MQHNTPPQPIPQDAKRVPGYECYWVTTDAEVWSTKHNSPKKMSDRRAHHGYRRVPLSKNGNVRDHMVHRLVLRAFRGEPREGEETRHLNGDPSDNRLDNLAWGTKKENSADQIRHGTTNRGERHVASKLTHADVVKIRERYAKGDISQRQLAEEYGVQQTVVGGIVRGEDWSHTLGPIKGVDYEIDRVLRGESHGMAKLSKDDVINIRKQYASGSVTQIELAENYKTKQAYISRVVLGKTWKHVGGPIKGEDY